MIGRRLLLPLLLAMPLLIPACAPPPPPSVVLTLTLAAGPRQNPDPARKPAPVAVRVFQLAATARFEHADVFALWEHERQTLGDEGIGSEEFVLRPGETRVVTRELNRGARFIGTAVLFRDIDRAVWRAFQPVPASGPVMLTLQTKGIKSILAPS